jgi:putative ABC transport system permease protein
MKTWNRLRFWLSRDRLGRELADEIGAHRGMLEEQYLQAGSPPQEARASTQRRFGNDLGNIELSRDEWGFRWLDALVRDAKFALRRMGRQPLLTLAAIVTVGLGVGANTAIVSVLETVLLNPLGLHNSDRIMAATVRFDGLSMKADSTSAVEFRELQNMKDAFSAVAAIEGRAWTSETGGEATRLTGKAVTPDFFRVFGQQPLAGRFFVPQDRESTVLSYRLWQTQFGGDKSALGRAIALDGQPYRIVGIAPAGFQYPPTTQLWTSLTLDPKRMQAQERGNNMNLALFARLRDSVTPQQGANRVNLYVAALKAQGSPDAADLTKLGYFIDLDSFAHYLSGDLRRPLWLLWAAALVVLFTGCANVAVLLLSRVAGRRREVAIRLSLGATRLQIVRQLLVESLLLGAMGGVCACHGEVVLHIDHHHCRL